MSREPLALLYGLSGFVYIIVATLPAANGEKRRFAAVDCPSLVAGRHIDNSAFRPAVGRPTLGSIAMPDGEFVDSKRLRAHDARQRLCRCW